MSDETSIINKDTLRGEPKDSHIFGLSTRSIIVMGVTFTVCYMSVRAFKIEEPLYTLATITIGYYFGQNQKNQKIT